MDTTMTDFKKIAVWQTAFLGDAVLTLPLIQTLAKAYPQAEIHFFVRKGVAPLFAAQKELAGVETFDKRGAQKGLAGAVSCGKELKKRGFDLMVSCHSSFRSALVAKSSGIPVRIGYDSPWFNRFAYTHTVPRRFDELEEIERLFQLLGPLGITDHVVWPRMDLPEDAKAAAERFWSERVTAPVIGLHPGSVWPTKRWPEEYFSRVLDMAVEKGLQVMVFAGPGEEAVAAKVIEGAAHGRSEAVIDLSAKLSLPELAAFIGKLSAYLTNDSGPMHISWIQRTPTVALFGPTVRELGFFPRGDHSFVLETDADCRPCGLHGGKVCKPGHHKCMRDITPERAFAAIKNAVEAHGAR